MKLKDDRFPDWCPYVAIVEGPDGVTYEQPFFDYQELGDLVSLVFGDGYRIVCVY